MYIHVYVYIHVYNHAIKSDDQVYVYVHLASIIIYRSNQVCECLCNACSSSIPAHDKTCSAGFDLSETNWTHTCDAKPLEFGCRGALEFDRCWAAGVP